MQTFTSRLTVGMGALALTAILAACGDSGEPGSAGTTPTTRQAPTDSAATSTPTDAIDQAHNDADTMFAQMMIVHHEGAIEMADLAVEKAESEDVRSLAEGISAAQGPEIERMKSMLDAWGEDTEPMGGMKGHGGMEMDGMSQEEVMAQLENLSGAEFDRTFLELMIEHHKGAVTMAEDELADGENPQALELAQTVVKDQQAEIAEMEQMLQDI